MTLQLKERGGESERLRRGDEKKQEVRRKLKKGRGREAKRNLGERRER